jgi:hypothetical protein
MYPTMPQSSNELKYGGTGSRYRMVFQVTGVEGDVRHIATTVNKRELTQEEIEKVARYLNGRLSSTSSGGVQYGSAKIVSTYDRVEGQKVRL